MVLLQDVSRLAAAAFSAWVLAASPVLAQTPGASPSPHAVYSMTVPSSYAERPVAVSLGSYQTLGFWVSPRKEAAESLNVGTEPSRSMTLEQYAKAANRRFLETGGQGAIAESHPAKICDGAQDGWFNVGSYDNGSQTFELEQTVALDATHAVIATYMRLKGTPEDPAARKALDSLCVR